jgi:hypothetical protein
VVALQIIISLALGLSHSTRLNSVSFPSLPLQLMVFKFATKSTLFGLRKENGRPELAFIVMLAKLRN